MALLLFELKKFRYVIYCSGLVLTLTVLRWIHFYRDVDVQKLAVYHVAGHSAMDLIDRGQHFFVADEAVRADTRALRYHVVPHRIMAGIKKENTEVKVHDFDGGRVIVWRGRTILQLIGENFKVPQGVKVDWLIVGKNCIRDVERLTREIQCRTVVLDSSNSFFFATRFLEAAKFYKLDVHSVLHQGAFVIEIENRDT